MSTEPRIARPALFICDLQERFQKAIYNFSAVASTTSKLLTAASILSVPVYVTTQNKRALGDTIKDILAQLPEDAVQVDKTLFSMCIPEILKKLEDEKIKTVTVVGIESHICVLQTTLDLLEHGYKVYVIRDGVSSCNPQEIPTALARMQQAGAVITTSESWLFEIVRDSAQPKFKAIANLVKETKQATKDNLEALAGSAGEESGGMSKI
ncbi:hypothetical protein H072_7997 [Dactylellina haptotyla CBS 200.50]|uniref:Isochorismatase-like domain-containing protein n=1 Tax=Dactylellina haptotyla (strain CBS 200.50) TaxID=1284197 RepID=S8AAT5_DACHA|nr:hypothetical protein H072_7997 [Dactylellina haptotyla CBS 200.50]